MTSDTVRPAHCSTSYESCWELRINGTAIAWFRHKADALAYLTEVHITNVEDIQLVNVMVHI